MPTIKQLQILYGYRRFKKFHLKFGSIKQSRPERIHSEVQFNAFISISAVTRQTSNYRSESQLRMWSQRSARAGDKMAKGRKKRYTVSRLYGKLPRFVLLEIVFAWVCVCLVIAKWQQTYTDDQECASIRRWSFHNASHECGWYETNFVDAYCCTSTDSGSWRHHVNIHHFFQLTFIFHL